MTSDHHPNCSATQLAAAASERERKAAQRKAEQAEQRLQKYEQRLAEVAAQQVREWCSPGMCPAFNILLTGDRCYLPGH